MTLEPRVVRDGPFEFRAVQPYDQWVIEYRVVEGNWDHRTFQRGEQAPALTAGRVRLWADLLDQPYDLTFEPEGTTPPKHVTNGE